VYFVDGADWVPKGLPTRPPKGKDPGDDAKLLAAMPPRAFMIIAGQDLNGLLWVNWSSPVPDSARRITLEIIDVERRQVVISQPVEKRLRFVANSSLISRAQSNSNGLVSIEILRPAVVRP
jgi:hypothetical protein